MIIFYFFVLDKDGKMRFFGKSFLLAKIKLDVMFKIFFLTISNANIHFKAQNLQ